MNELWSHFVGGTFFFKLYHKRLKENDEHIICQIKQIIKDNKINLLFDIIHLSPIVCCFATYCKQNSLEY